MYVYVCVCMCMHVCVCVCVQIAFEEGLLAENGTIAADNAFRGGRNYLPSDEPPDASRLFGDYVANDKRLHKVCHSFGIVCSCLTADPNDTKII